MTVPFPYSKHQSLVPHPIHHSLASSDHMTIFGLLVSLAGCFSHLLPGCDFLWALFHSAAPLFHTDCSAHAGLLFHLTHCRKCGKRTCRGQVDQVLTTGSMICPGRVWLQLILTSGTEAIPRGQWCSVPAVILPLGYMMLTRALLLPRTPGL